MKQSVPTRWNSDLIMLESFVKAFDEVKQLLCEKNKLEKLQNINHEAICELITFLKPFLECTEVFSRDKYPTFHEIVPWINELYRHLEQEYSDGEEIAELKKQEYVLMSIARLK